MNNKSIKVDNPLLSPERWLTEYGDYLFRYAMLQLRDEHLAEDVVQETLLAALECHQNFSGNASEKTWLVGILKHKVVDLIRKKVREPTQENLDEQMDHAQNDAIDAMFDDRGHWVTPPQDWGNPEKMMEQKRFWEIFTECMKRLPPQLALLYSLREISGMATDEICKDMNISPTNSWVMLHRARLGLKQCFEINWLGQE
ncbi:sigma-70 family RNA polymerase sigma factor [Sulfurirhabdus autotrophica]|uniref:RNA polymerase sigma factor n=1 Tax=Sulfurirhabdus autotrophica TaxID=1706046 RepID=A0A4V2W1Q8_9PROT|nr:sigma-70 family RNA polymerase sigma factor [Sulfurirhabdus autotrophica]TCV85169.1 RNA polymerase sigma-70 factor (ECF subfamily) [Sulfurirhabdus autotrophica]